MLNIRCKSCGKELTSSSKLQVCGCPNMMTLVDDKITALDLSQVILLNKTNSKKKESTFTPQELEYQESRKKRKVRRMDFETR